MLCRHGLSGTSFTRLLKESGAPRGSIYHYFPEGKAQLVAEALDYIERVIVDALRAYEPKQDTDQPAEFVVRYFALWHRILFSEEPLSAGGVLGIVDDPTRETVPANRVSQILETWERELQDTLVGLGVDRGPAQEIAGLMVVTIEGAALWCRVRRDPRPLEQSQRLVLSFVNSLEGRTPSVG